MAELTTAGLLIRRYPEIREAISTAIQQNSSADLLFEEDTILGQIVSVLSNQQAIVEQTLQHIYSSLDRDKAEGTVLDSLLYLVGLERLGAGYSSTDSMLFTASQGTTIANGFILENSSSKDRFQTTVTKLVDPSACYSAKYKVTAIPNNTLITVTVNSVDYTYTTDADATVKEIVDGLALAINNDTVATFSASVENDELLIITSDSVDAEISIAVVDHLETDNVSVYVSARAQETGPIRAPANTIDTPITPTTIVSVTNTEAIGLGRDRETDAEFRVRAARSLAVSGSATYGAVLAALLNLEHIGTVKIEENSTNSTNALGLPPHSFEAIVSAPDNDEVDQAIAKVLWDEKPLGIQTHGNTTVNYVDDTGVTRVLNFSRANTVVFAVRVTYSLYAEETPTTGIETEIRRLIVEYGNSLQAGEDVIPKRFYQSVYSGTDGLEDVTIDMQVIPSTGSTPNNGSWAETRIGVLPSQVASFNAADITFVAV